MTTLIAVGDDSRRHQFAQRITKNSSTEVHTTGEAAEAVLLLHRHRYELIIFDDTLEGMDPLEFGLTIRDLSPKQTVLLAATPKIEEQFRRLGPALSPHMIDSPERIEEVIDRFTNSEKGDS